MRDVAGHQMETAVGARAGFLDRPMLIVLGLSTALAGLVLGVVWLGINSL
jgi:hypothetical protein